MAHRVLVIVIVVVTVVVIVIVAVIIREFLDLVILGHIVIYSKNFGMLNNIEYNRTGVVRCQVLNWFLHMIIRIKKIRCLMTSTKHSQKFLEWIDNRHKSLNCED